MEGCDVLDRTALLKTHFVVPSGVVYQRIQPAELSDRLPDGLLTALRSVQIHADQPALGPLLLDFRLQFSSALRVAAYDHRYRSLGGTGLDNGGSRVAFDHAAARAERGS